MKCVCTKLAYFLIITVFDNFDLLVTSYMEMFRSSGADSIEQRGAPQFYNWLGTGGTVSRRTANKKLTKLY